MQNTIGFIGAGHMTAAIVGGLVNKMPPERIWVSNRSPSKLKALADKYKIQAAADNAELIANCGVIVLSVKPQDLKAVLAPLKPLLQQHKPLVISVVAGIRCASLVKWLGGELAIIRSMPNTPAVIGEGATALYASAQVEDAQRAIADQIFSSVGLVSWVNQETELDLVTALSGSGPAYFMLFIQSMIDAAVARGMSAESASTLAVQTASGTASMIANSDKSLPQMLDDMLLPGGTTERAVAALRQHGVPSAIDAALDAANARAAQLADELGA